MAQVHGLDCHPHGILGFGEPGGRVMFVGVAPGKDEIVSGRPRTGQAGKLMSAMLKAVGQNMDDYYNTNLMCYQQPKPTAEEIAECLPRVRREIARFAPKLIVTMGQVPSDALVPNLANRKGTRGAVLWSEDLHAYVMPTWEPAAVLWLQNAGLVSDLIRDLDKIKTIIGEWPEDGSVADVRYESVRDAGTAQRILGCLPADGTFVSVDIETTSSDPEVIDAETDDLLCIGFGWVDSATGQERIYVIEAGALVGVDWPRQDSGVRWTFQYGQFDTYGILRKCGVRIPIVEDTILLSYLLDERPGYHKLKVQAREYCGSGWYDETIDRSHLERSDYERDVVPYNAKDVAYTLRLVQRHLPRVEADSGLNNVYRRLLIPGANVFRDAQEYGVRLDVDKVDELYSKWEPEQRRIEEEIQELAAKEGFQGVLNPGSPQQLQKFFFQIVGLESKRKTKKGAPSVDKYVMDAIDHPVAAKIRDFRTYNVVLNLLLNYMQNLKPDGRLHPQPLLHNTATGRLAYHDPPIHGTPKAYTVGDELARVAECLCATDDDHEILIADYEQIEVWLCWAYTQDEQLHADLLSGDVHSGTAEGAFNTRRDLWTPELWQVKRQNAKKIRFGLMYGEGAEKLATPPPLGIGGSVKDCQTFIDNFWARYPAHKRKLLDWERAALDVGELVSGFGRKRRFPLVLDHRQLRQAINFPIQSTASDYALASAIELHPLLLALNAHILMTWHDALVIEYPKQRRDDVLPLVKQIMEKPKIEGFPAVKVEMKVGSNLNNVKKVKVAA